MIKISKQLTEFVRPSPHSKFSPSAIDRWLVDGCPFSIKFCEPIPEESNEYTVEGTLAHAVAEARVGETFYMIPFPEQLRIDIDMWIMQDVHKRSNAFQEMWEHAGAYVEVVRHWLSSKSPIGDVLWWGLEKGIPIYPDEGCFGTADCVIVGTKGSVVIDYKYGRGKAVGAESKQLLAYLVGIYGHIELTNQQIKDYRFYSVIHQPRLDVAPKEHTYNTLEVHEFRIKIHHSIQASKRAGLAPVEGNHCFWCPAKRTKNPDLMCPVMKEKPIKLAKENFGKFLADMQAPVDSLRDANPNRDAAMVKLMSLFPMIKAIVEAAEEEFEYRLAKGEYIDGVRVVEKVGNRTLNSEDPAETARMIKSMFPKVDPWKVIPATEKLKTITEIEKEVGKGKLDSLCVRKVSKQVEVLDEKVRSVLGDMQAYATMINNATKE